MFFQPSLCLRKISASSHFVLVQLQQVFTKEKACWSQNFPTIATQS